MASREKFEQFVLKLWGNQYFLILFIVNILSNMIAVVRFDDALSAFVILCISAVSATIESCICRLFRNATLSKCVLWFLVTLHMIVAIIDIFLAVNFQKLLSVAVVCIVAETTSSEASSFLSTYLDIRTVLCLIIAVVVVIWFSLWFSRRFERNRVAAIISMILTALGVTAYLSVASGHTFNADGINSISQLHSFTRLCHASVKFKEILGNMQSIRDINRHVIASSHQDEAPSVIVVIGESFSKYHSSLYGYPKQTNPLLAVRAEDGSLSVFDDVVSQSDHTGVALFSIFSANGSNEPGNTDVLFPTCFRKAGYKTALLDNQYFTGGYTWITDIPLSEIMFDYRNQHEVGHDANLLKEIPNFADPQLIVIHLIGQHYTYADRYPSEFKHFTAADYSSALTEDEREMLAHYDNASLYNDYVVESIIRKFQDKNCLVVYFSDHGEELYEIDDFMGHGNAAQRPTIDYQIRIPFMVWTSPQFQSKYPDVVKRIKESVHKPIITDYLAQFLFEAAGIDTKYYCPELSFINEKYPADISRIVLDNIDFDHRAKQEPIKTRY